MQAIRRWFLLVGLLSIVAAVQGFAQDAPARTGLSIEARAHLMDIIGVLRREWLHRDGFDWTEFTQRVLQKAGTAQTIPETYDAIRTGLQLLGDKHTYYIPTIGDTIFNPDSPTQSTGECTPPPAVTPTLPTDVVVRCHVRENDLIPLLKTFAYLDPIH